MVLGQRDLVHDRVTMQRRGAITHPEVSPHERAQNVTSVKSYKERHIRMRCSHIEQPREIFAMCHQWLLDHDRDAALERLNSEARVMVMVTRQKPGRGASVFRIWSWRCAPSVNPRFLRDRRCFDLMNRSDRQMRLDGWDNASASVVSPPEQHSATGCPGFPERQTHWLSSE